MKRTIIDNIQFPDGSLNRVFLSGNLIDKIEKLEVHSDNITFTSDYDDIYIDGRSKVLMPGFVNMHTHSPMTIMRGLSEDTALHDWLKSIWKIEAQLTEEQIFWGTKLACVEMFKTGTTCFFDEYRIKPEVSALAASEMGIRSYHPYDFLDFYNKSKKNSYCDECQRLYENSKSWNSRVKFAISVHSPYTVSPELITWAAEFARDKKILFNIHLSETEKEYNDSIHEHGVSPVAYLERLGALGPNMLAAHSLWLDENDIQLYAKYGITAIHNINSNLKLSSGYRFKYKELKEAGVRICVGTDGCASSNNLDILEALKTAALVQKAWRIDPTVMSLSDLISMATLNPAAALGLNIGSIKEGNLADLILINIDNYSFVPNINFLANLIYSANSSCVDTVICDGNIVMKNRIVQGEEEIYKKVNELYKKLL